MSKMMAWLKTSWKEKITRLTWWKENFDIVIAGILMPVVIGLLLYVWLVLPPEKLNEKFTNTTAIATVTIAIATGVYAFYTRRLVNATVSTAEASVRMAEEMRKQRRPIVVPKAVSSGVVNGLEIQYRDSDIFKVRNLGNSPAIELEVLLLNQGEGLMDSERRTFLAQTDEPIEFYPLGLEGQLNYTCYLVCRYRSSDEGKMWYLTKLPFVPKKSQRGDRIIIEPQELEFSRAFEKQSY